LLSILIHGLRDWLNIVAGESVCGRINCQKNRADPRSLRITLSIGGHLTASYLMSWLMSMLC